jgi:hypothetical protein
MPTSIVAPEKSGAELVGLYFIENRTRLLEIAAFLDRLDRADEPPDHDFRVVAFREALQILCTGDYPRIDKVQMVLSDPTLDPLPQLDAKSARGAYDGERRGG